MSDVLEMMESDETNIPTNDELSNISTLAQRQRALLLAIDEKETQLTKLKNDLKQVQEIDLPTEMASLGMDEIKLTTGEKVSIKSGYAGSISKANQPRAFSWLEANGYESLIKNDFTLKFGKGEKERAADLRDTLEKLGFNYSQKIHVHPQTLKSFIKEVMERQAEGEITVPEETFSIYRWNKAEVR